MKKYVSINGETMKLSNVVISKVEICQGVQYVPMNERFEVVMGWGFEIISDKKKAYSIVYTSRSAANAARIKLIEKISLAKSGDKLYC